MPVTSSAVEKFGNKIRVRVCGLLYEGERLLLINHKGLYGHDFWSPPGGGIEFGETAKTALKREFLEECKLDVNVGDFLFACEFVRPPLHTIELFFYVTTNGEAQLGHDPEMEGKQFLTGLQYWALTDFLKVPLHHKHGIFQEARRPELLPGLRGFFQIT